MSREEGSDAAKATTVLPGTPSTVRPSIADTLEKRAAKRREGGRVQGGGEGAVEIEDTRITEGQDGDGRVGGCGCRGVDVKENTLGT